MVRTLHGGDAVREGRMGVSGANDERSARPSRWARLCFCVPLAVRARHDRQTISPFDSLRHGTIQLAGHDAVSSPLVGEAHAASHCALPAVPVSLTRAMLHQLMIRSPESPPRPQCTLPHFPRCPIASPEAGDCPEHVQ